VGHLRINEFCRLYSGNVQQDCLLVKDGPPAFLGFYYCNLDLDPMTLVYELKVSVIGKCSRIYNKLSRSGISKVIVFMTNMQTNKQLLKL